MVQDMELDRIEEELRRHDERRKKIVERRNRRLRQIREKQLKDKEAWMKKFIPLLDKTLEERFGELYWYSLDAEDTCDGISHMEMKAKEPGASKEKGTSMPDKESREKPPDDPTVSGNEEEVFGQSSKINDGNDRRINE